VFRETGQTLRDSSPPARSIAMLAAAVLLFVFSHLGMATSAARGTLVRRLGEWGYLGFYSVVALATFAWMVAAFAAAPDARLWQAPTALRHLALSLVFLAVVLVVAGYTKANPTAVMLDRLPGDPCRGVTRVTRHPVLWGIALWAGAHLLANGDLAALVLFSGMAVLAVAGTFLIDRRRRFQGGAAWRALEARTSNVPFAAIRDGRAGAGVGQALAEIGWWRLALGAIVYALLLAVHPWIAGVPAFRL
jgi:uncharacterized membrane protein